MPASFAARRGTGKCDKCSIDIKVGEDIIVNDNFKPEHVRCPK